MSIKITGLLHAGVRIRPGDPETEKALAFYSGVLGLESDKERPFIPGIPGAWLNIHPGSRNPQVHIFGAEGASPAARSNQEDPTRAHLAFAVADLDEAGAELKRQGVHFWVYENLVGRGSDQVFFEDPFGNMIELQQAPA